MSVDTEDIKLYWIQGCGNCTRLKGYLTGRGIPYTPVNVMDDLDAVEEMRRRGILSLPAIRVGDRLVNGIDLAKVDEFLGLEAPTESRVLSSAELTDRAARVLETAAQLALQIPGDRFDEPTPTMENFSGAVLFTQDGSPYVPHGSFKSLVHHIAGHAQKFWRAALAFDGTYDLGYAAKLDGDYGLFGEPDLATPMYRVSEQMTLIAKDIRSWSTQHPDPDLSRVIPTFYRPQSVHQLLQTNMCSLIQHSRQLTEVIEERCGLKPDTRLLESDFEGLVMPAAIWK